MSPQREGDGRFSGSAVRAPALGRTAPHHRCGTAAERVAPRDPTATAAASERAAQGDPGRTAEQPSPRDPSTTATPRWAALFVRVWAGVRGVARWYSAINGGQDYQRYVAHLRRNHPGRPVPTEREYWRERYAEAERNPSTRCC